jgi:hypothetical protein
VRARRILPARVIALLLAFACAGVLGCSSCEADHAVAELAALTGDVQADDVLEPVAFTPAVVGRRFVVGEAVRTGEGATAELTLAGGGTLHVDPDSIVRFARDASAAGRLDVEQGSTTIEAADTPIEVETVFGVAHLDARSTTRIGPSSSRFEVVVGHATLERASGAPLSLDEGAAVDGTGDEVPALAATPPAPAPEIVSRTIEVRGAGAHVRSAGGTSFAPLASGSARVEVGSTLRTGVDTIIDVATSDGRIRMQPGSEMELTATAARASSGRFDVEGAGETRLEVPGGAIVLSGDEGRSGASVDLEAGDDAIVVVRSGRVIHERASGSEVLRPAPEIATADVADAPTPDTAPQAEERSAPVVLQAGESVVVHDPGAPTAVRIEASADCADAEWRLDHHAQRDASLRSALVRVLRPGSHPYELRCAAGARERGTVRVDRDRGVASMPHTAPRTVVDADGRPYSVLYQSLLPEILLRWPRATAAGPYEIEVTRGGSSRRVTSSTTSHTFASGEIAEGTTTFVFRARDGSRSPPTPVRIQFDNATPVASIRAPAPGVALADTVHVEGAVAEGATVSVSGTSLSVDHSARFEGDVPVPSNGCLAIRVALRGRGIHYYVRCGPER